MQGPDRLYKASKRLYKALTDYTRPQQIIQRLVILDKTQNILDQRKTQNILDKDLKRLTRVATHINLTYHIQDIMIKINILTKKVIL